MTPSEPRSVVLPQAGSPLRVLSLPIYLPSALMAVAQMALLVVLPLYVLHLGNGMAAAGLVFAMRALGSVVVNVPASLVIERYGHRASMALGTGLIGLSAVTIAMSGSTWVVATATLVFGAGMGTWLLARLAYITERVPNWQRGTSLSGLAGLQRLGMLVGPLLAGLGVEQVGYGVVFLAISATALVTMALIWVFVPAVGVRPGPSRTEAIGPSATLGLVTLVPSVLGRYRDIFCTAGVYIFSLQLLREQRRLLFVLWGTSIGVGVDEIGFIVSSASAVDMAMFPVAGYIMDHWGRKVAGVGCVVILATAMGLLPLTSTTLAYLLVAVMAGLGNGLGSGILLTMGADLAPSCERSQFLGVWRMVGDLGALAGPLLTSLAGSLVIALGLSSLIGLGGGVVLWWRVTETLSTERPSPAGTRAAS